MNPACHAQAEAALAVVRRRWPGATPRLGLVLGSGLGGLADGLEQSQALAYGELPGFPRPSVGGHGGRLLWGRLAGLELVVLQGRAHYYEGGRADAMAVPITCLKGLGCDGLLLTNAAGSLRVENGPGSVMLLRDHINFTGVSPLFAAEGDARFVDMTDAYDPELRARLRRAAEASGSALPEGTYIWFAGPQFETPAEIRMAALLGADAVGMSTVPEVILARQAGLRVAALSAITNLAAGLGEETLSHAQTQSQAAAGAATMTRILTRFAGDLAAEERTGERADE